MRPARPPAPGVRLLRRRVRHRLRPARAPRRLLDHRADRGGQVDHLRRHRLRPLRRPARLPRQQPHPQPVRRRRDARPRSPWSSRPRGATGCSTRSPAQTRPQRAVGHRPGRGPVEGGPRRGPGSTGVRLTRKRDVAERIAELVGLDKAQFEQVVLIPQGKFEEVLKARTQERADLLAKLFPVDVYLRTTEALRQLAAERRRGLRGADPGPGGHRGPDPGRRGGVPRRRPRHPIASPRTTDSTGDDVDRRRTAPGAARPRWWPCSPPSPRPRDDADAACTEARDRLAGVRTAVDRWRRWRADVAEAADPRRPARPPTRRRPGS